MAKVGRYFYTQISELSTLTGAFFIPFRPWYDVKLSDFHTADRAVYKLCRKDKHMKNIFEILAALGIVIPEDKKQDITKQVAENYKTVAEFEKVKSRLEVERDNYKDSLDTAQNSLKEFEGVDVKELNGKVAQLTADLAKKDTEYQAKISDMEFDATLDNAISASKARNVKALKALLDVEPLKASKNQAEDIKTAIENVKKDNDYLFECSEPIKNPVAPTGTPAAGEVSKETFAKMGYMQRLELKRTDPEKYEQLKG